MARILIVDDDTGLLQMVRLMLERAGHQVITAENGEAALAAAFGQGPDMALVDVMMPGMNGYDVTRALRGDPRTEALPIVILTARGQPMDRQMAIDAGASAYLSKPITAKELIAQVSDVITSPGTPTVSSKPPAPTAGSHNGTVAAPKAAPKAPEAVPTLPVITVIGLRGGSGSTTVAVNLAVLLRERNERICITDLSMAGGHVALQLHLATRTSWADLLPVAEPDQRAIAGVLTTHQPSGLVVMAAPSVPSVRSLSQETVIHTLSILSRGFQRIVVDAGTLNSATVGALLVSTAIIVVMSDDLSAVHTTSNMMQSLQGLGVEMGRVRVAVNRSRPEAGVPFQTIMKALGRPIAADIPYDANQVQALRHGTPLVVATPEASFSGAIKQLLRTL